MLLCLEVIFKFKNLTCMRIKKMEDDKYAGILGVVLDEGPV